VLVDVLFLLIMDNFERVELIQDNEANMIENIDLIDVVLVLYPKPTRPRVMWTSGGTLVRATVIVPSSPILRLEKAAARGSVVKSNAVATAELLAPKVIPRVI
jgi:hypothetical protein